MTENGRRETDLERLDRNLVELLQEVRVAQTGVQVLFGFLLAVAFTQRFRSSSTFQQADYFATLVATCVAAILLIAPTSCHRILYRLDDKQHIVRTANRLTMAGLVAIAFAMVGVVTLISDLLFNPPMTAVMAVLIAAGCAISWYILPFARRRKIRGFAYAKRRPAAQSGPLDAQELALSPAAIEPDRAPGSEAPRRPRR